MGCRVRGTMRWYEITFDRDEIDQGEGLKFIEEFAACVRSAGAAAGFLLFRPLIDAAGNSTYILPPSAKLLCPGILQKFKAVEIGKPAGGDVMMIVGTVNDARYWLGAGYHTFADGAR